MRGQNSRCNPTAGCILDSLALAIPTFHSKNEILKRKDGKSCLQSTIVSISKQHSVGEDDSKKCDAFVRASRLTSEQVKKDAIIPYVGKKRSRIEKEPTGILALVFQDKNQQGMGVSHVKRTKSSPRKSESKWSSERHAETFDSSSRHYSDLNQIHNVPRKSIPRKSVRDVSVHRKTRDSRKDEDDNEFEINCDDSSVTPVNEGTKETNLSSKVITPSPKRKVVRNHVEQDGRNILSDINSQVKSKCIQVNVKQKESSFRRKKRVSRSRNKRLTLALAKSVTLGKKTIPSRSAVTPDLRPVTHGETKELNVDSLTKEKNRNHVLMKPRKGRKEIFIGIPPSEASSLDKYEKSGKDTLEELSKRVEENRKIAQMGINLQFQKSQSFIETPFDINVSNGIIRNERCIRDIVSYMDQMIHQMKELKERVQKSDGVDLISITKLKKKFKLPTENEIFIGKTNTTDAKRKSNLENGGNEVALSESDTVSPSSLSRPKNNSVELHDNRSDEDEFTHVNERKRRRLVDFSDSDDSSVESNASSKRIVSEASKKRVLEKRMLLLQQNDTLVNVGVSNDSQTKINNSSMTSVVTVSPQPCKRVESFVSGASQPSFKPYTKITPSFLDGIDHKALLERRWQEEEARAIVLAESEKEIPGNDSDSDSDSDMSLSLFL